MRKALTRSHGMQAADFEQKKCRTIHYSEFRSKNSFIKLPNASNPKKL